jgi:hypothetical protein
VPTKSLLGFALLAVAACAAPSKTAVADEKPGQGATAGVFVGHGTDGELVMASTHYESMNGLAVGSQQLGVTAGRDEGGDFVCKRETVTGTHMPQWICRYKKEVEEDRLATQRMLDNIPKACMDRTCNQ